MVSKIENLRQVFPMIKNSIYEGEGMQVPGASAASNTNNASAEPTHVVKVNGQRVGTVVNGQYVPDK